MKKFLLRQQSALKSIALVVLAACLLVFVYPQGYEQVVGRPLPESVNKEFKLGLDLQGGTHLVYEADMQNIPEDKRAEAMEGVRDVIERRVNAFGVAEPVIQVNKSGESWRLIIELAGISDVNEAINLIGKTPLLEFKEENNQPLAELSAEQQKELDTFNAQAKSRAAEYRRRVAQNPQEFEAIKQELGQDSQNLQVDENGNATLSIQNVLEKDALVESLGYIGPAGLYADIYEEVKNVAAGGVVNKVIESQDGYNAIQVTGRQDDAKQVKASHILICYDGLSNCAESRTQEEAQALVASLKEQATPENFGELATENSDDPGSKESGGSLGWFNEGVMVPEFNDAAFSLKDGEISEVIETQFGYHIIYKAEERITPKVQVKRVWVKKKKAEDLLPPRELFVNTELSGKHLERALVDFDQTTGRPLINLEFNEEGKELFGEITERNVNKHIAIYLDGQSIIDTNGDEKIDQADIYAPRILQPIKDGRAQITGQVDLPTVKKIVKRLNSGALPVPIEMVNQQTVGATLGAQSIAQSVEAGVWGILLVMAFMLLYYRLPGLTAVLSLGVYAIGLLTFFKLFGIVLTLAGIAGFILSIGMAVDANVLIFERIKEELRMGKTLYAAIHDGFERAWTSIRDGNISTLITCVILMTFGTGMIKGFAITLGLGVLLSMFSAIVVTKLFLYAIAPKNLTHANSWLFPGAKK